MVRVVRVGVLKQYIKMGSVIFPRYVLYASMFSTLFLILMLNFDEVSFFSIYAAVVSLLASIVFWYESLRIWNQKP